MVPYLVREWPNAFFVVYATLPLPPREKDAGVCVGGVAVAQTLRCGQAIISGHGLPQRELSLADMSCIPTIIILDTKNDPETHPPPELVLSTNYSLMLLTT